MPTAEQNQKKIDVPLLRRSWTPAKMAGVTSGVCEGGDLAILGAAFFAIVLLPNFAQRSMTVGEFLHLRITLYNVVAAVFCFSAWRIILWSVGLYTPRRPRSLVDYCLRLMGGLTICTVIAGLLLVATGKTGYFVRAISRFWVICLVLMLVMRVVLLLFYWHVRPRLRPKREVLILGTGNRAWQACHELLEHSEIKYEILGFLDSQPQEGYVPKDMILGGAEDLESLLAQRVVDEVVIALPVKSQYEVIGKAVAVCQELGIQAQYSTDQFGTPLTKRRYSVGPQRGRMVLQVVHYDYRRHLKRAIDILGSVFGLIVLSPLLLLVAILVKVTSPGPIIFKQERYGRNKRKFGMLKFRSMVVNAEALQAQLEHLNEIKGPTFKIKKDPRITPIGSFIRKMSIDELPQLINVLTGDMSLVGPRPLPTRDVSKFSEPWLLRRFSVTPGLTCLWQVSGRSNTDFEQWIDLDLQYIDNWSLTLDFVILLKTIPAVLKGRGAA